jgi:RHS repeat-associated protein
VRLVFGCGDYYPFGLTMAGISSKAMGKLENKKKFNSGTELNTDFDLSIYETRFRSYDPQIGRFLQIDPIANMALNFSPYAYASNNPIFYNDPLGLLSTKENPQELAEVIVTAKKKGSGGGFGGFHWPSMHADQGRWSDKMYSRIRDNKPLNQSGDPSWLRSQTAFHKRSYQADQDYRKMQLIGVGIIASPIAIFGAIEAAPAIAALANSGTAAAVGDAAIKIRAASALADFTVQAAVTRDIKSVNINSVVGSFVLCNPLAGSAFGNMFEAKLSDPLSLEIHNPLSASTSSTILLSTTVGVVSSSLSGSMNQMFTASPAFNEYLTGLYSNFFSTGLQNKLVNTNKTDDK